MIGKVKELGAEFQVAPFVETKNLHHGKVPIDDPRPSDRIAARVAVGADRLVHKGGRVKEVVNVLLRTWQVRIDSCGIAKATFKPAGTTAILDGSEAAAENRKWHAVRKGKNSACLPPPYYIVQHAAGVPQESMAAA